MLEAEVKIYENKPLQFSGKVEVSACYVEVDHKLLLLQNSSEKKEVDLWSIPGGKLDANETPLEAAKRELFEETGIWLDLQSVFTPLGSLYICKPDIEYVFHVFQVILQERPLVQVSSEHQSYQWCSMNEARKMALIEGGRDTLERYWKRKIL